MKIEKTFKVDAPCEEVWDFITDPGRVASCIPGCEGAEETGPGQYEATINVKVGPVRTTFKVNIEQTEARPPQFAAYTTKGEEGSRASRISATSTLELEALSPETTEVRYASDIQIVGRLGKFGSGMMQKIADNIGAEFAAAIKQELEGPEAPVTVAPEGERPAPPKRVFSIGVRWFWWAMLAGLAIAVLMWWLS